MSKQSKHARHAPSGSKPRNHPISDCHKVPRPPNKHALPNVRSDITSILLVIAATATLVLDGCVYSKGLSSAYNGVTALNTDGTPYTRIANKNSAFLSTASSKAEGTNSASILIERIDGYVTDFQASSETFSLKSNRNTTPIPITQGKHILTLKLRKIDPRLGITWKPDLLVSLDYISLECIVHCTLNAEHIYQLTALSTSSGFRIQLWDSTNTHNQIEVDHWTFSATNHYEITGSIPFHR